MESWKAEEKQSRVVESTESRCNSAKVRRKKIHPRPNVGEVAKCCVLSIIRVSDQSTSRPVKAAGAEASGQRRNQKLHAAVAKSAFPSPNVKKNDGVGPLFWSCNVEKLHVAVAGSTLSHENIKKNEGLEALSEVLMSQNYTPLWRKAHFHMKMLKKGGSGSAFWNSAVAKLHAAVARSTFSSQNHPKPDGVGALFEGPM